jgi:hypothetical protein
MSQCAKLTKLLNKVAPGRSDTVNLTIDVYGLLYIYGYEFIQRNKKFKIVILAKTIELYQSKYAPAHLKYILEDYFCRMTGEAITNWIFVNGHPFVPMIIINCMKILTGYNVAYRYKNQTTIDGHWNMTDMHLYWAATMDIMLLRFRDRRLGL